MLIDQDKLLKKFSDYLIQEGASEKTKKNYAADLVDFFSWLSKSNTSLATVTQSSIQKYVDYLLSKQKTISTVNRRLSTLRIFFLSCNDQKISQPDPMMNFHNLENIPRIQIEHTELFSSWNSHLAQKGFSKYSISDHVNVVREFLEWLKMNQKL